MIDNEILRNISYIILAIIAILQIRSFYKTKQKINNFANVFSIDKDGLAQNKEYANIIIFITNYIDHCKKHSSKPKLNEAKKISEEHLEKLEDAINRSLITPLYLGLMGTIIGVIFGLWEYTVAVDTSNAIDYIIGSVKVAMSVTALGLLLTVWNSTLNFSKAKDMIEEGKLIFYNDYLIIRWGFTSDVEGGLAEVVNEMKRGLDHFNDTLSANLEGMNAGFTNAIESAKAIKQINLQKLREVLNEINVSVAHFENLDKKFKNVDIYLTKMASLIEGIAGLDSVRESTQSIQQMTQNLNIISEKMSDSFGENKALLDENAKLTEKLLGYLEGNAEALNNMNTSAQTAAMVVERDVKELNKKVIESIGKSEESFKAKWDETQANMLVVFTDMQKSLKGFDNHMNELNEKLKQSIEIQVISITDSFDKAFSPFVSHIKSLTDKVNDTDLQKIANEAVLTEMERITMAMTKSFEVVCKSMEQWQNDMAKNIKTDIENKLKNNSINELENSIITLSRDLQEIKENSKHRNIFRIIKDMFLSY